MNSLNVNKNRMPFRIIFHSLFCEDAVIAWISSIVLVFIGSLSIAEIISALAAASGTIVAICTGFFAMLKMYENYKEARSKRREQEAHEKEELENEHNEHMGI